MVRPAAAAAHPIHTAPPPPLQAASRLGKELGCPLRLSAFLRVQRGEGLETNKVDFATEVEQMVKAA